MTEHLENRTDRDKDGKAVSPLERVMYRSVPLWIVLLISALGVLGAWAFGALSLSAERGSQAPLDRVARRVAALPNSVWGVLTNSRVEPFLSPAGGAPLSGGFWRNPADDFADTGFLLTTLYDWERRQP